MAIGSLPDGTPAGRWRIGGLWLLVLAGATLAMLPARRVLDEAHVALVFLLVVLGASASGGRGPGLAVAGTAFILFDLFFLLPYYTLALENPFDWLILLAFLVTSAVAANLLDRLRREAGEATARTAELAQLASLGAQALNAPRADDALAGVCKVIQETLGVERAAVHPIPTGIVDRDGMDGSGAAERHVMSEGVPVALLADGVRRLATTGATCESLDWLASTRVTTLLLPLRVRDAVVGVLDVQDARGFTLTRAQRRFVDALAFYAALGVERRRMEEQLDHVEALRVADRLKTALLASVSHDLRTPLTSIKAFAHGLMELGDVRSELIAQEADRLNQMVSDLLDLSRLTSRSLNVSLELHPVDDLVAAAVQQVEGALGTRPLDVQLGADSPLLVGRFDLMLSIRVLVNLIDNARKYAPPDTAIELGVARVGEWIELTVADRGQGIAPAESDRIFAPFYRPPSATPDAGSAGLGLAIARGLAEAQGGELTYSARAGGGSVFALRLPAVELP